MWRLIALFRTPRLRTDDITPNFSLYDLTINILQFPLSHE
uniref:Uncharacterized protein n=1 Tax=Solanum lycopersicum TaxID=4081 RepID=A0A3Q7HA46_SOLLC